MIDVRDVWFWYNNGDEPALRGVSLSIDSGEVVSIIGQNGGGKTTLAKHLNGLLKPSKGAVLVDGRDTRETPTHILASTVAYVFQNPSHQIFMSTVYDEVAYGPLQQNLPKSAIDNRVATALEMVGLGAVDTKIHPYDLDYGQMKLLTIASAIAMNPDVIVLDEPTTGQDHRGRRKVAEVVKRLNNMGKTIIIITHDMKFVTETARRTVVMANGQIIADGPTSAIMSDVELLARAAIKPPQTVQLAHALNERGYRLRMLTISEALEELGKMLKRQPGW
ncbi:cobalt/nickel ABC transporter ATP-binding protein [Candidatus Caldarchaeum subterraneum]|uniref:Cobalt/nickel ABC transporter ATP-binding protein n=1 Tax=Caldiarchaeum subterraneum TaxID=311458 RepID=E6N734_CALS0|nr:cobalt/nickel ABC transporter ATP-binding protein [Candidatus Caldarchaeum subterraneum]BAJ50886.1 cobalt/nickel ABC transporter ATP-binding protein [Candidatus Caldarchaeum subterraneum]GBC72334.1 Energy-coupling factor transporter ATP-binding protein EcfA2 [archaeon HR03]